MYSVYILCGKKEKLIKIHIFIGWKKKTAIVCIYFWFLYSLAQSGRFKRYSLNAWSKRKKTATIYHFHRKKWKVTMMLWIGTMKLWWCIGLRKWSNARQILNAITFLSCHSTKSLGSFIYFMMIMNTLKKRLQMQQKLPQKRQRSLRILTVMWSLAISWRSKSNRNNNSNWKKIANEIFQAHSCSTINWNSIKKLFVR